MTKYPSINTYLWIGDGNPTSASEMFFKVNGLMDISLPKIKADTIDVTTQDETDSYHDWLSTLIDSGEASFNIVFDPNDTTQNSTPGVVGTNAGGLKWLLDNKLRRNMRFEFSYTSPVTRMRFIGIVTGFAGDAKVKGYLGNSLTIKVVQKVTLEAGTGSANP